MSAEAEQLAALAPVGVLVLDDASSVVSSNAEACRQLGLDARELAGRPIASLVGAGTRFFLQTHVFTNLALRGRVDEIYLSFVRPTDAPLPVVLSAQRQTSGTSFHDVLAWIPIHRRHLVEHDLIRAYEQAEAAATSEREATARATALEAQVAISERMASIGTLAASVAHELNNPLAYVAMNLELLQADARLVPETRGMLRDAVQGVERIREIVATLRRLSRVDTPKREPTDLAEVVQVALKLAGSPLRQRAEVRVEIPTPAPRVLGDEGRLCQVLVNLLVNAAQALPEGRAGNQVALRVTRESGRAVLEVEDNGPGISAENQLRIFDPFFTTKPAGEGTGLGLAVCTRIVSAMGGALSVRSRPSEGATFRIELPEIDMRADPSPTREATPTPSPEPEGARILVVEDDDAIARVIERTLRGARITRCASGHEAFAKITAAGPEAFDAVLCDLMMPDGTGDQLHARLVASYPALARRVIFMSGGAFSGEARTFLERTAQPWIEKPFSVSTLRETVRKMVAEHA